MLHPQETFVKLERETPDKKAGPVAALKRWSLQVVSIKLLRTLQ